jgi:hypothetical protein
MLSQHKHQATFEIPAAELTSQQQLREKKKIRTNCHKNCCGQGKLKVYEDVAIYDIDIKTFCSGSFHSMAVPS